MYKKERESVCVSEHVCMRKSVENADSLCRVVRCETVEGSAQAGQEDCSWRFFINCLSRACTTQVHTSLLTAIFHQILTDWHPSLAFP